MKKLASALALLALLGAGCEKGTSPTSNGKMRVGVIDPTRILQDMPEYRDLQSSLVKERGNFLASLPKDASKLTKEKFDRVRGDAEKKQGEWQKRILEMTQVSIKQITATTAEIAKARNLDIVIVNTPATNTINFLDGQDITLDVMLKLHK